MPGVAKPGMLAMGDVPGCCAPAVKGVAAIGGDTGVVTTGAGEGLGAIVVGRLPSITVAAAGLFTGTVPVPATGVAGGAGATGDGTLLTDTGSGVGTTGADT